jgi:hypothetical protein
VLHRPIETTAVIGDGGLSVLREESEENGLTALAAGEHTSTVVAIPPLAAISLGFS